MIKDLDNIYKSAGNAAGEQEGDPPVHPGDMYLTQRKNQQQNMQSAGASFKVEGVSKSDQQKFFGKTGIYDPALTGQNIALEAGNRQSFGNKLVRRLANLVPNITADLLDMVGSLSSLVTEWGDDRDYRNGLNTLADSIKNPAGENYKRSNDTWAFGDPTWWLDNFFNTVEYAGAYALGGAGVARTLGSIAKTAGATFNLGEAGMAWMNGAAKLGTSAFVSYAQGAQDGASVFKAAYETQFKKAIANGQDAETAANTAKHIAAQAAATTAQLSTVLTMAINTGAYTPVLKSQNAVVKDILASRIAQAESAGISGVLKALRTTTIDEASKKLLHRNGIRGVLDEMWREGGEEVLQQFAQQTGMDVGNKGQVKGFFEQFAELENIVDRVGNSEGLFAFTLGSVFGGLQHTMLHNVIPSRYTEKLNPDGSFIPKMNGETPVVDKNNVPVFQKHWVTPRTYEKDFTKQYFNSTRDALAHDFEEHERLRTDFLKAVKEKDSLKADELRDEMFNVGQLYAIKEGVADSWKNTFKRISEMSPEQAMQSGYAESPDDTTYKQRAEEAITGINTLENVYNGLIKRYDASGENQGARALVDMLFARRADLYSTKKRIDRYEKELEESEKEEDGLLRETSVKKLNDQVQTLIRKYNSMSVVGKQIDTDLNTLLSGDTAKVKKLLKKYRAVGYGEDISADGLKDLAHKLANKKEQLATDIANTENALFIDPEYKTWVDKNPDKSFNQYLAEVNRQSRTNEQNRFRRVQLEMAKTEYEIALDNYDTITEEKNITRFSKKAEEWFSNLKKEGEKIEKLKMQRIAAMTKDAATLERLKRVETNTIAEKYRLRRDNVHDRIAENHRKAEELRDEIAKSVSNPGKVKELRLARMRLLKVNKGLSEQAALLDTLYRTNNVSTEPETKPADKEKIDGTENGKLTQQADDAPTTQVTTETEPPVSVPDIGLEDELNALVQAVEDSVQKPEISDPVADFNELYNIAPKAIQSKVNYIVNAMMTGEIGHSLDSLNQEINAGMIKAEDARKLLLAVREYVEELQRNLQKENQEKLQEDPPQSQKPVIIVKKISEPDTPAVISDPEVAGTVVENEMYHSGYKTVHATMTGATTTIGYVEGARKMKNGRMAWVKVVKPGELNPNSSEKILKSKELLAGHALRYEIDLEYDGPKQITDSIAWDKDGNVEMSTERTTDYLDKNGNVKMSDDQVGNIPIVVLDAATGERLFHIRKMDWITAQLPGTKDYRNVAESTKTVPDNIEEQKRILLDLRRKIAENYNNNRQGVDGNISTEGKGTGRLILNYVIKDENRQDMKYELVYDLAYNRKNPEKSMIPDESLEMVIVGNDYMPKTGKNFNFQKSIGIDTKSLFPGTVGLMVPAANGKYMFAPLVGMKLAEEGKPSVAVNSVIRAIELFLLNDGSRPDITEEISQLEQKTNFNVATASGLKAFVNQYFTYTQDFDDSAIQPGADTKDRAERFVFNINTDIESVADKAKIVKIGFNMRGDGAIYADLTNGSLSNRFKENLAKGFTERARAVVFTDTSIGIKGLNSRGKFHDSAYVPGKGWVHNEYQSYNQYIKSFSKTPVYGRNRLSDGTYVYTANPHLNITMPIMPDVLVKPAGHINKVNLENSNNDADLFDSLSNFSYREEKRRKVSAIATGLDNSNPLTLATLQKKYNFTAEEQRNGKTPLEVFEELSARGHTYIPDGYNPFSRCL